MADFSKMRTTLQAASEDIKTMNKNLVNSDKYAEGLIKNMADLASMSSVKGSIWSVIGRFSKGQAFFIQKQLRGFTVLAKVLVNIERDRIKEAEKLESLMTTQGDMLDTFLKSYKDISSIEKTRFDRNEKAVGKAIMMQDTVNKLKLREMTYAEVISKNKQMAMRGIKEQLSAERKLVDTDKARLKLSRESKKILGDNRTGFFGDPDKEASIVQLLGIDEEIKTFKQARDATSNLDDPTGVVRKEYQNEMNKRYDMRKALSQELSGMGINVRTGRDRLTRSITKTPTESFFTKLQKNPKSTIKQMFLPSQQILNLMKRSLLVWATKKNFNKIFRFTVMGLKVFGKLLLGISLLGVLVYALHKSGFIERVQTFLENENVKKLLSFYFDTVYYFFEGIFKVISGVFKILYGLFAGDTGTLKEGFKQLGEGLIAILLGGIGIIIQTAMLSAIGVVLGAVNVLVSVIEGTYKAAATTGKKISNNLPKAGIIGGAIAGAKMGGTAGSIIPGAGTLGGAVVGGVLGGAAGGLIGYGADKAIDGMASGGSVKGGGMFMVGEKGPELVNLPTGAKVFNNSQTKSMMGSTTINVSVNGRLGASDTELDDIARKIGRKINLEMNRYNNSGYRA